MEEAAGARQLVFGDDGSPGADAAWSWVNQHPWRGWHLEVLTCVPTGHASADVEPWQTPHPRRLPGAADGPTRLTHLRVGAEPRTAFAGLDHGDLLVVGAKGRGRRKSLHLGSVSEHLVAASAVPLVIARSGRAARRVVVCADGSAHARRAVEVFADLPTAATAQVLVASVPQQGTDAGTAARAAAERLAGRVASVEWCVLERDPTAASHRPDLLLLELVGREDTDLVVLGSSGLSGLSALRAGSLAKAVAGKAPCSVLLTRAG